MKPEDLLKVWDAPDVTQLTTNQYSIRLPIDVAAKIAALCEMYPKRTRTEIIGGLLSTALDEIEGGFPFIKGIETGDFDSERGEPVYEDLGPRPRFHALTEKYLKELKGEQATEADVAASRRILYREMQRKRRNVNR